MERINEIIIKTLKVNNDEVEKDLTMADVARWDSLTHMDLIVTIENELNIQLTGDDIADMITFDSIRKIVAKYL